MVVSDLIVILSHPRCACHLQALLLWDVRMAVCQCRDLRLHEIVVGLPQTISYLSVAIQQWINEMTGCSTHIMQDDVTQ